VEWSGVEWSGVDMGGMVSRARAKLSNISASYNRDNSNVAQDNSDSSSIDFEEFSENLRYTSFRTSSPVQRPQRSRAYEFGKR